MIVFIIFALFEENDYEREIISGTNSS